VLAAFCGFLMLAAVLRAQPPWSMSGFQPVIYGTAAPVINCSTASIYVQVATAPSLWLCTATNTWSQLGWASAAGVPTGAIIFVASGTCPSGYSEVAGLDGRMVRGTVAANGNVGGTGGSDTITPAGTNGAPALTMNSYTPAGTNGTAAFTPAGTNAAITAGTPAGTNSTSATTGNCAATNVAIGTGATNACKATAPNLSVTAQTFTGSALATHTHTFTGSSGTVPAETFTGSAAVLTGSVAAPTFTGTQFDNRAAYINLIGCSKS
jgi:hypothetical protein